MPRAILGTLTATALVAACSTNPQPTPLSGEPANIQALDGQWIGEYHSYDPSDRSGTLLLRLAAGQDTARGDVLLHIAGRETAAMVPLTTDDPWADVSDEQTLDVTFVRAAGGAVFGKLDIYNDPVCGCEVRTTLTGRIKGNLLEGTYITEHVNGADRHTGRWRVVRSFREPGTT